MAEAIKLNGLLVKKDGRPATVMRVTALGTARQLDFTKANPASEPRTVFIGAHIEKGQLPKEVRSLSPDDYRPANRKEMEGAAARGELAPPIGIDAG
jgi:hypothetical protein